ncbi:hypothetical protein HAX54_043549 [Datura stramonium]|uniref:Uncharacterized protein n=1 Tax=Datura stramonium TaxID=4076 RepID=A0ABS8W172_DATST|nr:hypothetical protein [Datura stramonium]
MERNVSVAVVCWYLCNGNGADHQGSVSSYFAFAFGVQLVFQRQISESCRTSASLCYRQQFSFVQRTEDEQLPSSLQQKGEQPGNKQYRCQQMVTKETSNIVVRQMSNKTTNNIDCRISLSERSVI